MKPLFYVTTPIYYVNGAPHLGHAYTSIAADTLARFKRLDGHDVLFLTGTDEHGQKVEKAAAAAGMVPAAFADLVSAQFRAMADGLDIGYDQFVRTTEPRHKAACAALWERAKAAGAIYLGHYEGWYSVRDEAFYGEDELDRGAAAPVARESGSPVEWVREPSWFFRLSAYQDRLIAFHENNPEFLAPAARRNEVLSFLKSGLKDLSISRTSFRWGIPVPDDPGHVMYVWFDALANYLTAVGFPDGNATLAPFWPADLHLVGKEIARFHAVYWPAFLMAAELPLPRRVFSHGWWMVEGEKMSKSAGNGLDPIGLAARYGLDPLRYFLLREVPFGGDGDFRHEAIVTRLDRELANDLGNLAQRTLSLVARNCDARRPAAGPATGEDTDIVQAASDLVGRVRAALDRQAFSEALEAVWQVIRAANVYIDRQAPWALRKTDAARMEAVLRVLLDVLRPVSLLLWPFMPRSMDRLMDQLGIPPALRTIAGLQASLAAGETLPAPQGVFPRFGGTAPARSAAC
jgi:methionyl-tRNA synthetase